MSLFSKAASGASRLIVVYGTLKKGYGNNRLLQGKTFVSEVTVPGFMLYDCGFPVARPREDGVILGELWDIGDDTQCLCNLDRLEGNGRMYNRTPVQAQAGEEKIEAEMYVGGEAFWFSPSRSGSLRVCDKDDQDRYVWSGYKF